MVMLLPSGWCLYWQMLLPFVLWLLVLPLWPSIVPKGVPLLLLLLLFPYGRCYCQGGWWYCHVYDWQMLLPYGWCFYHCCHMAITSANHIHGNTISHPGNNICHKEITTTTTTVVHLLVQLMVKVVIPTVTKQMAITSANTNINQMATTSPSAIKKTKQLAITPAKTET